MDLTKKFLEDVTKFLEKTGMSKTMLGLNAVNDHHAIIDWLSGKRKPLMKNVDKVYYYMAHYRKPIKK